MYLIETMIESSPGSQAISSLSDAKARFEDICKKMREFNFDDGYVILYDLDDTFVCGVLLDFVHSGETKEFINANNINTLAKFYINKGTSYLIRTEE